MIKIRKEDLLQIAAVLLMVICFILLIKTGYISLPIHRNHMSNVEVHFIDVGQGDSILIRAAHADMLVDAGLNSKGSTVVNYLKQHHVKKLKYVIGTHPHPDHIGGLDTVINALPVDEIILPSVNSNIKDYKDVLSAVKVHKIPIRYARLKDSYFLGDVTFTILAPCCDSYSMINNYSICIKILYGRTSFLLTGDAERLSEEEMIKYDENLSADVLKLGHHGAAGSSSMAFLEAVNPEYAVICAGKDNKYHLPHPVTLLKMLDQGIALYRTDYQGTLVFTSNGKSISVNKKAYQITKNDLINHE